MNYLSVNGNLKILLKKCSQGLKGEDVIGHIPKHLAKTRNYILLAGGGISAQVTGHRQNKGNNSLDIPCLFQVKAPKSKAIHAECMIKKYLKQMKKNNLMPDIATYINMIYNNI